VSTFTERSSLLRIEELATLTSDDDTFLAERRVTKEYIESHDCGCHTIVDVSSLTTSGESFENGEIDLLSELKLDVEFTASASFGFTFEGDSESLNVSRDLEATEDESVLPTVEAGIVQRSSQSVGVRGDQGVPNCVRGFAVESTVVARLFRLRFRSGAFSFVRLRRNDPHCDVVVSDRSCLLETKTVDVGENLKFLAIYSTGIRTFGES
jgi:hypothetical protein